MHILIGLLLTLTALYWWLIGHWFARVVMLFPIAAMLGVAGLCVGASIPQKAPAPAAPPTPAAMVKHAPDGWEAFEAVTPSKGEYGFLPALPDPPTTPAAQPSGFLTGLGGLTGLVAAWFVSGIPIYYHRRRVRDARWLP